MTAEERALELADLPVEKIPAKAIAFSEYICRMFGWSRVNMLTALAVYANRDEGLPTKETTWTIPDSIYEALAEKYPGIYDTTPPAKVGVAMSASKPDETCLVTTGKSQSPNWQLFFPA